jgi:redox-sensitive bicupin YhaK (pirin superfamily)
MSAGTGIRHSEYNASKSEELKLFQIWIIPNERNVTPRYDQMKIDSGKMKNNFLQLVSPNKNDDGSWIHQDAWIHMATLDKHVKLEYEMKHPGNGLYIMVVNGSVDINENHLDPRDAIGIAKTEKVPFFAKKDSQVLVIEVPLKLS